MTEPRISDRAKEDLRQIWSEIAGRRGPVSADRATTQILKKCREHARFPETGRLRPELGTELRSFPAAPYVVFFQPAEGTIEVLRVLHGRRDIDRILRDEG